MDNVSYRCQCLVVANGGLRIAGKGHRGCVKGEGKGKSFKSCRGREGMGKI